MDLIQVVLRCELRHKLPYAFVKSAVSYHIWTGAEGGADEFIVE